MKQHNHTWKGGCTPTWKSWDSMLQRCTNPAAPDYKDYGGRGIVVCKRWLVFANFLADMGERPDDKTLDRRDNKLGYQKANCRWATRAEQAQNRRSTRLSWVIVRLIRERAAGGEAQAVLAADYGVKQPTISDIVRGATWRE